jgi:uncharacterized repeat protein (TIGR01451 family)
VTDTFPPAFIGVSWSCTATGGGTCAIASGTGNITTTVDLPSGATATFAATGTVAPSAIAALTNTATVVLSTDPDPANNTATASVTVTPQSADLLISKTGPTSVGPGGRLTYTIVVNNLGPFDAQGVSVADPTPAGLTFVSTSGDCVTAFPCALGTVPVGARRTIVATYTVAGSRAPAAITNTASVTSATADPSPANSSATAVTTIRRSVGCDLDGFGTNAVVTSAGPGGDPHVQAFRLVGGVPVAFASFYAYELGPESGAFVACGDVTGSGVADIVTGPGSNRPPEVRVFHMVSGSPVLVASFLAYEPTFLGGVHVAVADVDGDGLADIITAPEKGGGPRVRAFSLATGTPVAIANFFAYDPSFTGGVFVAGGDVDGDGRAEIITGASRQGGPLRVFKRDALGAITELTSFYPYIPAFLGPVRVAAADVNGDGLADVITAAGPGGGPHVQAFSLAGGVPVALASFYAYDPAWCDVGGPIDPVLCDGVYVAGVDVTGDGRAEIITGTNRAGGPVRIFQILGGGGVAELMSFYPYIPGFLGPVRVASASTLHLWPAMPASPPELPADDERACVVVSARHALLTSPPDTAAAGT